MRMFYDIVRQTLQTLWAQKLRAFLTMFGIAWGVGSLLLLVGLGEGFRSGQHRQLQTMGTNIVWTFGGRVPAVVGSSNSSRVYWLTMRDYQAIKDEAKLVGNISPVLNRQDIRASSDFNNTSGEVFGVAPAYNRIRTIPLIQGRWLNDQDEAEVRHVTILGFEMRKNMFPGRPALGSIILLNGTRFEVIGVLEKIGREENNGTNIRAFIPLSAMRESFPMKGENMPPDVVSFLNWQPVAAQFDQQASDQVHRIIARNHGFDRTVKDAFEEEDSVEEERMVGKIFDTMDWFLGGVGVVTLLLGAIGIVNIMLVSVSERTQEIGLRKALGATNNNIRSQFLLEGAFLTGLSGFLGLAGAAGFMALLGMLPQPPGFDTPRVVPQSAAAAITLLALAGIFAGLYPAVKASHMEPVEALRKE